MANKSDTTVSSIRKLATLLEISHVAAQKWVRHPQWPFASGPWSESLVPKMKEWADRTLQRNPAAGSVANPGDPNDSMGLTEARRQKVITEAKILGLRFQEQNELVHDVASCRQQQVELLNNTKLALTRHLPFDLVRHVRDRERTVGRPLSDLEFADIARTVIEGAITSKLANGPVTRS